MEHESPKGFLFESIPYYSNESIELMIDKLSIRESTYMITQALNFAYSKNIFSLTESEILSKSLRILNKEIYSYDDTTGKKSDNVENN
jgi:hypothetical protein